MKTKGIETIAVIPTPNKRGGWDWKSPEFGRDRVCFYPLEARVNSFKDGDEIVVRPLEARPTGRADKRGVPIWVHPAVFVRREWRTSYTDPPTVICGSNEYSAQSVNWAGYETNDADKTVRIKLIIVAPDGQQLELVWPTGAIDVCVGRADKLLAYADETVRSEMMEWARKLREEQQQRNVVAHAQSQQWLRKLVDWARDINSRPEPAPLTVRVRAEEINWCGGWWEVEYVGGDVSKEAITADPPIISWEEKFRHFFYDEAEETPEEIKEILQAIQRWKNWHRLQIEIVPGKVTVRDWELANLNLFVRNVDIEADV